MKLNWAERWVVNNPCRVIEQGYEFRWMKSKMPLKSGGRILEVGCGRGAGASIILREFHPALLHATDLDLEMLHKAKGYLTRSERSRIALLTADASHLPYRNESLDAVFGFGVLHHIPNWRAAVSEIARVLKPGGVYFMEELYPTLYQNFITKHILLHPAKDRFGSDDLKRTLLNSGFSIRDVLEVKVFGILAVLVKT